MTFHITRLRTILIILNILRGFYMQRFTITV